MGLIALHHLRVFAVVARLGRVRRAADSLMRAPSAVSRSIDLLERQLGSPVFERQSRGMILTRAGELALARYARLEQHLSVVLSEAGIRGAEAPPGVVEQLFDERRLMAASLLADLQRMADVGLRLQIRQPAVSAAIHGLEHALGQPLFRRHGHGLQASGPGVRWLRRFDLALSELRDLEADVAALRGSLEGRIVIGALPLMRTRVLPQAIARLLAAHPRLQVRAHEDPYEALCARLRRGHIDFILGALRPQIEADLSSEPLFVERLGVIAAARHALAGRRTLELSDLRGQAWVLSRPDTPLRASLAQFFAQRGESPPRPSVETGDLALVRGLLYEAGMLTVLSTHQLQHEIDAGAVCVLPVDLQGLHRTIGVTVRKDACLTPGAQALLDAIKALSPSVDE
ncbi:MAG: LysR substrate-binding domain-containing protein [Comamonas sp.]